MLTLKQTAAAAVFALGSAAALAGTMGAVCTPGNVTVPCERTAWDFGAQALYLQTTGADFGTVTTVGTSATYADFNDDWGWGFKIEGSYHFNTGNDLNLNWYHFRKTTTHNFGAGVVPGTVTSISLRPEWDAVNLEFGQRVNFGEQDSIRFHGGAQYAHVERQSNLYNSPFFGDFTSVGLERKFNGFGPRVGADMSYDLTNGFSIYANAATALLVGDSKVYDNFNTATTVGAFNLYGSRTVLVPELEGKLGATYTYAMPQGDVTFDVGYMWVNYIDVHHNPFPGFVTSNVTNFGLDGVYAGAKWVGNVA